MTSRTAARRLELRKLLEARDLGSQEEIARSLGRVGFPVSQSTVSRDLAAVGAVRAGDGRYVLGGTQGESEETEATAELRRLMAEFVVDLRGSGNVAVIRTSPGAASTVAEALDRCRRPDVLGTVAGDDTIFAAAADDLGGAALAAALTGLLDRRIREASGTTGWRGETQR